MTFAIKQVTKFELNLTQESLQAHEHAPATQGMVAALKRRTPRIAQNTACKAVLQNYLLHLFYLVGLSLTETMSCNKFFE